MSTTVPLMTADDLLELPDDGRRHELVRGDLREMSPAGSFHGELSMAIAGHLHQHVKTHGLGRVFSSDTGFCIARNPDTVFAPDASFVSQERIAAIGRRDGYWPEAPDLVVEVISPTDRYVEVDAKVQDWLAAGCRLVIVVDPRQRTVAVHRSATHVTRLTPADTLDGSDVVPGWQLPIAEVFSDE